MNSLLLHDMYMRWPHSNGPKNTFLKKDLTDVNLEILKVAVNLKKHEAYGHNLEELQWMIAMTRQKIKQLRRVFS